MVGFLFRVTIPVYDSRNDHKLRDALEADTIILTVPFGEHREVAKALPGWKGKTVIDAMNTLGVPTEELDGCWRAEGAFAMPGLIVRQHGRISTARRHGLSRRCGAGAIAFRA